MEASPLRKRKGVSTAPRNWESKQPPSKKREGSTKRRKQHDSKGEGAATHNHSTREENAAAPPSCEAAFPRAWDSVSLLLSFWVGDALWLVLPSLHPIGGALFTPLWVVLRPSPHSFGTTRSEWRVVGAKSARRNASLTWRAVVGIGLKIFMM